MTIHFFTKSDDTWATSRFRGYLLADAIAEQGVATVMHGPPEHRPSYQFSRKRFKEFRKHWKILRSLGKDDVVYLVRTIYQIDFLFLIIIAKLFWGVRYIFDFDDPKYMEFPVKMWLMTRLADHVVVGSHALQDWAKKHNDQVTIVPTSVHMGRYGAFTKEYGGHKQEQITIGWIGNGNSHYENLALLIPVFEALYQQGMPIAFTLIGALGNPKTYDLFAGLQAQGMPITLIDSVQWEDPKAVPSAISTFDIGVMPLVDNEWNKGKCAFKAIEYMGCGVATVCSDVGENNYLIEHGVNGLLVTDTASWIAAITTLIQDNKLRARFGRLGQQTIQERYSLAASATTVIAIVQEVLTHNAPS